MTILVNYLSTTATLWVCIGIDRDVVTVDTKALVWCRIQPSRGNAGSNPAASTKI